MNKGVVFSGMLLLLLPQAGQGQPGGRIAFQSARDSQWEIYVMNTDGSDQRNLTNRTSVDVHPAWSPDGTKIAFASNRKGSFQIFVMDADGGNPIQLTDHPGHQVAPAWSPDGMQIAFSSDREGDFDIFVMQADGSDAINVTQSPGKDTHPTWSADGTRLSFTSQRDRLAVADASGGIEELAFGGPGASDIFVMDALGGAATNLTRAYDATRNLHPSWSPVGDRILFAFSLFFGCDDPMRVCRVTQDLILTDANDGGRTSLGVGLSNLQYPTWSADSSWIAFGSWDGVIDAESAGGLLSFDWEIYIISASGGDPVNISRTPGFDTSPAWSPVPQQDGTAVKAASWGWVKERIGRVGTEDAD